MRLPLLFYLTPTCGEKIDPSCAAIAYKTSMLTQPPLLLRLEEASILVATTYAYNHLHLSWLFFALLFFAPDLSMLGYLINSRLGSATYNLAHTLAWPIALLLLSRTSSHPRLTAISLIWIAHIAFDRLLGYGLKYPTFFKDTHLHHIPNESTRSI